MAGGEDTLEWARRRADELIAGITDDAELLALIRDPSESVPLVAATPAPPPSEAPIPVPPVTVPAIEEVKPKPSIAPRREVRYSLEHPVDVRTPDWSDFIELCTKDISLGGMFVQSVTPPPLRSQISVRIRLPHNAGKLRLDAEVVHIVTREDAAATGIAPGFGLQFGDLTPQRRVMLDKLLEHAASQSAQSPAMQGPTLEELGFRCAGASGSSLRLTLSEAELHEVRSLREELASMRKRGDLELLGVREGAELEELRGALATLAEKWQPRVGAQFVQPEVRALATEIFLRLQDAYGRLSRPQRLAEIAARKAAGPAAPPDAPREPEAVAPAIPGATRTSRLNARNLVRRLVDRGSKLTSRLTPPAPEAPRVPKAAPPGLNPLLGKAYELISSKDYVAADEVLQQALRLQPNDTRAQVLLHFARARQGVATRDYIVATRQYEAILRLDPNNAMAKRELLMVSALDR